VGYSPDSNDVSTEAEEFSLLRAVARERLVNTLQVGEDLIAICEVWKSASVIVICSYDL
jgi:hypothetical protein